MVGPGPGLPGRHGRADADGAVLVRRGGDDPAPTDSADDDRPPAQRGLVALLHRGEEGIEVDVQHRCLRPHGPRTYRHWASNRAQPEPAIRFSTGAASGPARGRESGEPSHMKTLTASPPEALLAMVPCVLGFHPEHSIVLPTFGAASSPFNAPPHP